MEHIRQFDWCYSQPDVYFLKESDFTHSVTEKILRNKFRDPLISSDSDEETPVIDWEEVFSKASNNNRKNRVFVPGLHPLPQYPKVSSITRQQHIQALKVLCSQNPHILESEFMPRPTKNDYKVFEEIKDIYEKEQKEFIEWAKSQWVTSHCIRALRPKPPVETAYEARYKMQIAEMKSYPTKYALAAQIPLETQNICDMVYVKDLVNVDIKELPKISYNFPNHFTIMKHCSVPEPCDKHSCKFILPMEKSVTELPLTEVQRELAQYAAENDAQYIASESALRCLVELDKLWHITVTVCSAFGPDGETRNIVVLGREFSIQKESVLIRTYKAFKHLLENALVTPSEKKKLLNKNTEKNALEVTKQKNFMDDMVASSDEEDCNLLIDEDQCKDNSENEDDDTSKHSDDDKIKRKTEETIEKGTEMPKTKELYTCTCKDTIFERPPPRSFKKWLIKNKGQMSLDVIVHCSHKVRDEEGEVVLEPVAEYQLDLGAAALPEPRRRALALALRLRRRAHLLTVRIDSASGEVVTLERGGREEAHGEEVAGRLHGALHPLRQLLPGHYVLRHEPSHGPNAMLYVAKSSATDLILNFNESILEKDDAKDLKTAPTLAPILLPMHKYRKILPCAFSTLPVQTRPARTHPARHRTPPQAIKWPKKNKKGKKKN